ncbi:sugar transferase [Shouchella clausii]|jgi:lipopolysaccharide/colanic/teichoic acid biosynthesis glycosyltransferase|uniref:sugar transferase n=1 Tax=Shouchella TaxID=2893057 RepID=UPI0004E680EF|nr:MULTISPECIES: sugar transferase [Shouchella]MCM3311040.1 sugar transferase [Psychrobacillus sp. MER TA 17]ALA53340.1 Undecaprenyl-phosphate galactosephosphotransferase [Shouchella clausii]MBU3231134.1 sugar transferase [Shouchella clausii]MBU3263862.1 sugar transferase [Shouchella clausii]MBU3508176.1 sugar transferase [Shouchella clausii]
MEATRTEVIRKENEKKTLDIQINDSIGYLFIKRTLDIVASLIGMVVLFPSLVLVALLIKIEDPKGPIFFKQTRVGKDGKQFSMYKFRSMVSNAEDLLEDLLDNNEVSGLMFKMKDDPRVTKVGKFIRKTSIDELPQLLNVLKGDMSLVGPRPPLPREVAEYSTYHKQRLLVKPGCTGVWQVSARNSVGFEEMVKLDLEYMENRNIILDLKIIFKTAVILFIPNNAY